jgi:hypothetical protein
VPHQPHGSHFCSFNKPGLHLPQGLCMCFSHWMNTLVLLLLSSNVGTSERFPLKVALSFPVSITLSHPWVFYGSCHSLWLPWFHCTHVFLHYNVGAEPMFFLFFAVSQNWQEGWKVVN